MKLKKIVVLFCLVLLLSGCHGVGFEPAYELLRPPKPSGEKAEIQKTLEQYAGTDIVLKYPQSGEYRSAFVTTQLTEGESNEAFVFYRPKADTAGIHCVFMEKSGGKWVVRKDIAKAEASAVSQIVFSDLNGDGRKEVLIGWGTYSKDNLGEVYQWDQGDPQILMSNYLYTSSYIADFDGDSLDEIAAIVLDATNQTSEMSLLKLRDGRLQTIGKTQLDGKVSGYSLMTFGEIDEDGTKGLFLDGAKGNNSLITEIVYWNDQLSRLENPLYDEETGETSATLRNIATSCKDINDDGIVEVPFVLQPNEELMDGENMISAQGDYYTIWRRYELTGRKFVSVLTTAINYNGGYYVVIPEKWQNQVKFRIRGDTRTMTFYIVTYQNGDLLLPKEEKVAEIQIFSKNDWESQSHSEYEILAQQNDIIYAGRVYELYEEYGWDMWDLKNSFHMIAN